MINFLNTYDKINEVTFPDQDLLTALFEGKWRPLSWRYNALRTLRYIHTNTWSDSEVACVHYILPDKPWQSRKTSADTELQFGTVNKWWWDHFDRLAPDLQQSDPAGWELVRRHVDNLAS